MTEAGTAGFQPALAWDETLEAETLDAPAAYAAAGAPMRLAELEETVAAEPA